MSGGGETTWGGEEWRQLELITRAEEGERELGSEGERCGELWGAARLL
jgi:hypothetical protein